MCTSIDGETAEVDTLRRTNLAQRHHAENLVSLLPCSLGYGILLPRYPFLLCHLLFGFLPRRPLFIWLPLHSIFVGVRQAFDPLLARLFGAKGGSHCTFKFRPNQVSGLYITALSAAVANNVDLPCSKRSDASRVHKEYVPDVLLLGYRNPSSNAVPVPRA